MYICRYLLQAHALRYNSNIKVVFELSFSFPCIWQLYLSVTDVYVHVYQSFVFTLSLTSFTSGHLYNSVKMLGMDFKH